MITWQVVQAQDISQACSMSMPWTSNSEHKLAPLGDSKDFPSGQRAS
jgi:hypothetical protein